MVQFFGPFTVLRPQIGRVHEPGSLPAPICICSGQPLVISVRLDPSVYLYSSVCQDMKRCARIGLSKFCMVLSQKGCIQVGLRLLCALLLVEPIPACPSFVTKLTVRILPGPSLWSAL